MTLSANLLQTLESICTDHELAIYIKVLVLHFIYNIDVLIDGQMFLFIIP